VAEDGGCLAKRWAAQLALHAPLGQGAHRRPRGLRGQSGTALQGGEKVLAQVAQALVQP